MHPKKPTIKLSGFSFFFIFLLGRSSVVEERGKESKQELHFSEGPGTDMNVPVQNSVCCSVKRDPLSGWRPHDAQEDDIGMKLCGRRSRGSPDAQSPHSSHLQGRADDVNHDMTSLRPRYVVQVTCSVWRTFELYSDQNTTACKHTCGCIL